MLNYCFKMVSGQFNHVDKATVDSTFHTMTSNPGECIFWMMVAIVISFIICSRGLQNRVEKISKYMMSCLFAVLGDAIFAALTTIIAVFENIVAFAMDLGWTRKKAVIVNFVLIVVLSLPCTLGFSVLSLIEPLGFGTNIQDLEDFIVTNNLLPLGSLLYLMFCTSHYGWEWKNLHSLSIIYCQLYLF
ncbi:hypothetical protein [Amedibacillus sp. YH-ame10]